MKVLVLSLTLIISVCVMAQNVAEKEVKSFTPFRHKYSVEQLHKKFSVPMMKEARKEMSLLQDVNEKGPYKASLESLDKHNAPEWYTDAKLGIFFDWGLYSIAGYAEKGWSRARYPDWYLANMYSGCKHYHDSVWGADFERDDFIPLFTARNFNAARIASLVRESGAKYFIPFNKHHDGYCLWDSKFTQRDVIDMPPHRDITAELFRECRKENLYCGFYFSVEDYEYPVINDKGKLQLRLWSTNIAPDNAGVVEQAGDKYLAFDPVFHNKLVSGKVPVKNFTDDYLIPQGKDFIDRYDPDILWFDGEWQRTADFYKTPALVAYFYNRAEGRKEVVANDRMGMGTREHHGDFYTSETDEVVEPQKYPWEENRSMSESYGYYHKDTLSSYLSADDLIQMMVRIVAKGGNLNLIVNPDGSGEIPAIQESLLKELGAWLTVNGEAIYGTRTYQVTCDNTQLGQPVWYTRSKDGRYGYAICFEWPKGETFICVGANPKWETEVRLLGYDKAISWVETPKWGLVAKIPDEMLYDASKRPCQHAWVFRFEWDKADEFGVKR